MNYYKKKPKIIIPWFINKLLFIALLFVITIVILKSNHNYKEKFYETVYTDNISFAKINKLYQNYFGSSLPFNLFNEPIQTVFNEELKYKSITKYLDGANLEVDTNYLVPSLENGIVIYIGEKEGYNNTVIVECENGIEVWYSNIETINVKMYDYIKKGSLIGETNNNLYLVFMKDGNILNYEDYL